MPLTFPAQERKGDLVSAPQSWHFGIYARFSIKLHWSRALALQSQLGFRIAFDFSILTRLRTMEVRTWRAIRHAISTLVVSSKVGYQSVGELSTDRPSATHLG